MRPLFLDNPRAYHTPRTASNPLHGYAGEHYKPSFFERLYWRLFSWLGK